MSSRRLHQVPTNRNYKCFLLSRSLCRCSFSKGSRRLRFSRRYLIRIWTTRDAFDTCRDVNRIQLLATEWRNLIVAVMKNILHSSYVKIMIKITYFKRAIHIIRESNVCFNLNMFTYQLFRNENLA